MMRLRAIDSVVPAAVIIAVAVVTSSCRCLLFSDVGHLFLNEKLLIMCILKNPYHFSYHIMYACMHFYVYIYVYMLVGKPHERFVRDGDNLHHVCKVTLAEALTGVRKGVLSLDTNPRRILIEEVRRRTRRRKRRNYHC